jgi:MazG family protein
MVRRHPHIFGDAQANDTSEVLRNWEAIKAEERRAAGKPEKKDESLLDGVSSKAPALMEAHQLATKAARVGFDWKQIEDIFAKVREEVDELEAAVKEGGEADEAREELGDLFFALANVARHLRIEPEAALKSANRKFRRRFRTIEEGLRAQNRELQGTSLDEMEAFWHKAKEEERAKAVQAASQASQATE